MKVLIHSLGLFWVLTLAATACLAREIPPGSEGYRTAVQPFLAKHCLRCHGTEQPKGDFNLASLTGNLDTDAEWEQWNRIYDALHSGDMPPEDEQQPSNTVRQGVISWIDTGLRAAADRRSQQATRPTTRRLTNVEYQNTLRDLLGIDLQLSDNLPQDPVKPYRFHNTAEFMRIGPEQIDRYLECARRAMASVIVDPEEPTVHRTRREWQPHGLDKQLGADEVGVWGNRRNTPATGMRLRSFPQTGEYRIRLQASAILPPGIQQLPLRLVMGYGLGKNSSTLQIEPVGTIQLRNSPDAPQVFEFRGRIENHPAEPGRMVKGQRQPATMTITPQNLYDDGTLNDGRRDLEMPRAVIEWLEFEAPLTEVWPPAHHTRILFPSPLRESNPRAYVQQVLKRFMTRAFRRTVSTQEIERFTKVYELLSPELDSFEASMRETLAMVLVAPQFLYHVEAAPTGSSHQYELASRLSYFLWSSMPDAELIQLAEDQQLDDPQVLATQVERLLADTRSHAFVDNFTTQWLSLAKLHTVPINRELFPRFLYYVAAGERAGTEVPYRPTIRDYMHAETVGFVAELLRRNASVLQIVDSDFAVLNQPLAVHYGVEGIQGNELRAVPVTPQHRLGGLLTQGAILIANGTGTAPHPIYRAVWLREAILGDDVPPPPADVPALADSAGESAEKALSIKDLLAQHRQEESCNQCHAQLDPWGIPFERYNAIGKFQPRVPKQGTRVKGFRKQEYADLAEYLAYLQSLNSVTVEATARVPRGPQIDGMPALKKHLLAHYTDHIAENVIRRLLAYGLGRELTYRDRFQVEALLAQARKDDYKLRSMIVSVCQCTTFRRIHSEDK